MSASDNEKAPHRLAPGEAKEIVTREPFKVPPPLPASMVVEAVQWKQGQSIDARHNWLRAVMQDQALSEAAIRVAAVIMMMIGSETGEAYPSAPNLAKTSRVDRRTVFRAIQALENRRWIRICRKEGSPNFYRLTWCPELMGILKEWWQLSAQARRQRLTAPVTGVSPLPVTGRSPHPWQGGHPNRIENRLEEQGEDWAADRRLDGSLESSRPDPFTWDPETEELIAETAGELRQLAQFFADGGMKLRRGP